MFHVHIYTYIYLCVCVFWVYKYAPFLMELSGFVCVQQRSKTPLHSATPQAPAALCSGPLFWQVQDLRRCLRSTTTRKIATAQQYTYESIQIYTCIECTHMYIYIYACVIFLRIYIYLYVWYKCTGQTYMHDTDTITMCVHICSVCNRCMICRQNPNILVHVYLYIYICIYIYVDI